MSKKDGRLQIMKRHWPNIHAPFNCMFCYIYSCIVLYNELKHNTNVTMLGLANAKNMSLRLTLRLISFTKIWNVIKLYVYLGIIKLHGKHVYFCWNIFNYLKKKHIFTATATYFTDTKYLFVSTKYRSYNITKRMHLK